MALACSNHPQVPAGYTCFDCHGALCDECIRTRDDGMIVCQACLTGEIPLADEPQGGLVPVSDVPSGPPAYPCVGHPEVAAVIGCSVCRGLMCATCDFVFDDLHLCPACAVLSRETITPQRKSMGMWSMGVAFGLLGLSLLMIIVVIAARSSGGMEKGAVAALGLFLIAVAILSVGGSTTGLLLGIYSFQRRSPNAWYMWFGTITNGLIGAFWILATLTTVITAAMK